jgi:hypothetical protein
LLEAYLGKVRLLSFIKVELAGTTVLGLQWCYHDTVYVLDGTIISLVLLLIKLSCFIWWKTCWWRCYLIICCSILIVTSGNVWLAVLWPFLILMILI